MLLRIFKTLAPTSIPRMEQAALDARVLLFALGMALACGMLFGMAPAAANPLELLAGSRVFGGSRNSLRHALSAAQNRAVAGAAVLRRAAASKPLEFGERGHRLESRARDRGRHHRRTRPLSQSQSRQQFFDDLAARLRALPGVNSVAASDTLPPTGFIHSRPLGALRVSGMPPADQGSGRIAAWRIVSPEYFGTLGIPIVAGGRSGAGHDAGRRIR